MNQEGLMFPKTQKKRKKKMKHPKSIIHEKEWDMLLMHAPGRKL